jgi:two-component system OmpR family response regulator
MQHVLLAIDDAALCGSASDYLNRQGYLTSSATSGEAINRVSQEGAADVLVVDASGCADDALRVCSAIRTVSAVPMILLSARDDSEERIRGLDAGADDCLVKPFNPRELMARIKVVCRRASFSPRPDNAPRGYRFGEWRLDVPSHTLEHADGSTRILTASEFRLLEALLTHPQQQLSRARLLQLLHGDAWRRYQRSIEARMSRMRRMLRESANPAAQTLIRSVYGAGYVFESSVTKDYLLLPPGRDASWLLR